MWIAGTSRSTDTFGTTPAPNRIGRPHYRDIVAAKLQRAPLSGSDLAETVEVNTSMALHLGTYAAAVENMLRRMHDEDTTPEQYWLHQVQIRLKEAELAPDVRGELSEWFGGVPLTKLSDLGARAVRYVNVHEAPGSISLAIDPRVIMRVRTISLPTPTTVLPATEAGKQAVELAVSELLAAQRLLPDTTGLAKGQYFHSELDLLLAQLKGRAVSEEVIQRTKEFAPRFRESQDRKDEIRSKLRTELAGIYVPEVTPQLRERLCAAIPTVTEPAEFHQRLRELAGLIALPDLVVGQFQTAPWRTPGSAGRSTSGGVQVKQVT
ncbi:hypothetical protein IU470_18705 [Nocardia abscessus]|uniref:Uncharacterized protein n=1 Tax=Nocardia abscessus TaxID=120957 RepID=A0ABS0CFD9_9NOCA|nr:hypothetical protein [Nocardia abscessus]MBF6227128.1 hypothetical protein [Nocardia abscessus]